jgi:hypothetical protein
MGKLLREIRREWTALHIASKNEYTGAESSCPSPLLRRKRLAKELLCLAIEAMKDITPTCKMQKLG